MKCIYAIPGLGTTEELFQNISVLNFKIIVLKWPQPKENYSLKEYAACFLSQIDVSKPSILMGVSFGGMLCSELAEIVSTDKVILISSCKDQSEFPLSLKIIRALSLNRLFSERTLRRIIKSSRGLLGFEKAFEPCFYEMIDKMPKDYFSNSANYILNWRKNKSTQSFVRIHGTRDRLLNYFDKTKFYLINGGSHAMVLNRANEINSILNKELNGL